MKSARRSAWDKWFAQPIPPKTPKLHAVQHQGLGYTERQAHGRVIQEVIALELITQTLPSPSAGLLFVVQPFRICPRTPSKELFKTVGLFLACSQINNQQYARDAMSWD
jgi:hypothetical protein